MVTAGMGIGHAISCLALGSSADASAWMVVAGGLGMLTIICAGIYQSRKQSNDIQESR